MTENMTNYFDFDDCPENDDTYDRIMNRSRFSLAEACEFDEDFVNRILNKTVLDEADKYNIATVVSNAMYQLLDSNQVSKSFDDFIHEVMGDEWYTNITAKWLQRFGNQWAIEAGVPELINNKGVYLITPNED